MQSSPLVPGALPPITNSCPLLSRCFIQAPVRFPDSLEVVFSFSDYPFNLLLAYRGEQVGGGCLHVVHDFDRSSRIGSEFNRAGNLLRDTRRSPLTKYSDITILP